MNFPAGNAFVFYTTDGTVPTHVSPVYSAPIPMNRPLSIRAMAYYPGVCIDSSVALAVFTVAQGTGSGGSSGGSGSSGSGSSGGIDAGGCAAGVTQCTGASAVQTCDRAGQWEAPWPCASGTCSGGVCTGSTIVSTSCQGSGGPGLNDCGAGTESCCMSLEVTGGTYCRSYDLQSINNVYPRLSADGGPTQLANPATVSGFRLDKYLVTVGRFRQFVGAWNEGAGYTPSAGSGKHVHLNGGSGLNATAGGYEPGWLTTDNGNIAPTDTNLACDPTLATWTSTAGTQETLPINCVNWYEAYAFCIWDGGFLPSEAEWEYAAAGGSQQRFYPWGSTDPGTDNRYAIYSSYYTGNPMYIAPVGTATLGAGLWGQLDLAGEVWEWDLDSYADYAEFCTDCANATAASWRVLRGGTFFSAPVDLLPPIRNYDPPSDRFFENGFRCGRTP
jgi:formylglycine-generating enzyme required for sulfatase activity